MTTTSPVAKLTAGLPKSNGLTRAVPHLFHRRGDLVPFFGYIRIEEAGLDADDNQHLRASIQRLELATGGPLAADAKDFITRCSSAATSVNGQLTLMPPSNNDDEARRELLGYLDEWAKEQTPPLDTAAVTDLWQSWHGGYYDARLEEAPVPHLREFCLVKGVLADDEPDTSEAEGDADPDDGTE